MVGNDFYSCSSDINMPINKKNQLVFYILNILVRL